jgi:stage II sporulation protein R
MVIRHHFHFPFPFRLSYGYLFFALMVLVMSWEGQHNDAALAAGVIPQQSIRLRILANSDGAADQAVKRHIRDAVVAEMKQFAEGPQSIEEARTTIQSRIPRLERLVGRELAANGFRYSYKVELGIVPFPTKMYGSRVYPAGNYEALRITLGDGLGQNWWCVLFPPLCFVDGVTGEASPDAGAAAAAAAQPSSGAAGSAAQDSEGKPEVRFFLLDVVRSIANFFKGLFG